MSGPPVTKYGPLLLERREGCCDFTPTPCSECAAYIAGVKDAMTNKNLVVCGDCDDVHDLRWHVASGMVRPFRDLLSRRGKPGEGVTP